MSPDTAFAVVTGCGVGAVALAAAALFTQPRQVHAEPAAPPEPSPVEWFARHDLRCGHTSTPHEPTPVGGLVCLNCGTTTLTTRTETS